MPPEENQSTDVNQPAPEAETAPVETPAPPSAQTPAPTEAPTEAPQASPDKLVSAEPPRSEPETAASPEATAGTQPATQTAQLPPSEPFDSAQDKPIPAQSEPIDPTPVATQPEPPSAAAPASTGILNTARDLLVKARVSIQDRKRKKRDKIMEALAKKNQITNDEVEKMLHVSDATATRYLHQLEKEGKIIQVGKEGKGVVYIKTP